MKIGTTVTITEEFTFKSPGGRTVLPKGTRFTHNSEGVYLTDKGLIIIMGHGLDTLVPNDYIKVNVVDLPEEYLSKRATVQQAMTRIKKMFAEYYDDGDGIPAPERAKLVAVLEKKLEEIKNTKAPIRREVEK